jgi:monovalent cation/hydrogen antiporter
MPSIEVLLLLLVAVAVLALLARRISVPYPIVLVLGGVVLGLAPGLPRIVLQPDLIFLVFLPPLLYSDAWATSWRDFKANLRSISLLAIGLVICTLVVVAVVAHSVIPGFSWEAAFVLGAIVSPTDAVASTSIAERLGVPRRIVTIVSGESLVNDATGLVAYRFAVAAVVTGAFSLVSAGFQFVLVVVGGVAIGIVAGKLFNWIERFLDNSPVEITLSFLVPFAAYIVAEQVNVSGVLAVVAAGLVGGRQSSRVLSASTRLEATPVWNMVTFVLNGILFIVIGLQLRSLLDLLSAEPIGALMLYGVAVSAAVIVARLAWVFPSAYLPRFLFPSIRARDAYPSWRAIVVIGWMGMRGALSLAAALALPTAVAGGAPFAQRPIIIFLTFCVIIATLVGQGLTLPLAIRWLGIKDDGGAQREETVARLAGARAALKRIDELAREGWAPPEAIAYQRAVQKHRIHRFDGDGDADEAGRDEAMDAARRRLRREMLAAEREAVIRLRNEGTINDEVLHRIERELDLQQVWMDV